MTKRECIECHKKAKNKSYYCEEHRKELWGLQKNQKVNA